MGHHLTDPSTKKQEQPRHIKPGQRGLAATLTMFVTTALFPSQAQMREVREIWDYHELFMTLKPKSPLYEIISADWGGSCHAASDIILNGVNIKVTCVKYEWFWTHSIKIQILIGIMLIDGSGRL